MSVEGLAQLAVLIDRSWLCCMAASFLLCMVLLSAQTPDASVSGLVADTEDHALAEVKVTATQPATGFTQTTTTGANGEYYFVSLPRGIKILTFARSEER